MAFPFNTVPGPQSTGEYAVVSCRPSPWIYMHADMNYLIFHSTGRAARPYQKNTSLQTAVRQNNSRIIHATVFITFDCLTSFLFFSFFFWQPFMIFTPAPSVSLSVLFFFQCLLTFLSHHLCVSLFFVNVLFSSRASRLPLSLFFPALLSFFSPLTVSHLFCVRCSARWRWETLTVAGVSADVGSSPAPLVSCLRRCVTGVTGSRHALRRGHVFDVVVSLREDGIWGRRAPSHRQPPRHLSQHHWRLLHRCKALRFTGDGPAEINCTGSVMDICFVLSPLFEEPPLHFLVWL